jgi:hypothetical protein
MYEGDVLTGTPDPQDNGLTRDLVRKMKRSLLPSDIVLAPLGVGGHVDHVIVRRAAEALDQPLVLYYPEIPYTALYPDQALAAQSGRAPRPYRISSSNMHAWIDAVSKYASQRSMLESAAGSLPEVISACADAGLSLFESRNKNALTVRKDHANCNLRLQETGPPAGYSVRARSCVGIFVAPASRVLRHGKHRWNQ